MRMARRIRGHKYLLKDCVNRCCKDKTGEAGYFPNEPIVSGGLGREYHLYVHARYKHNRPTPLVFLFHGSGWTADLMMGYTNMAAFADAFKSIVVAPKGIRRSWDVSSGSDDVTFIADIVETKADSLRFHFSNS